ncbi:hypothetical protein IAU59_004187 [Kwoniella sp. CBS 9459]
MSIYSFPPPNTPAYRSMTSTSMKIDPDSLAMRIRQLKRSPESPSKLTLPPIMGIIAEQDEQEEDSQGDDDDEQESDVSVSIEEVDDFLSSPSDYEAEDDDEERQQDYCYDIDVLRSENVLWVIEEESEEGHQEHGSVEEAEFGMQAKDSFDPVDRYSSPPPSPSLHRSGPVCPLLDEGYHYATLAHDQDVEAEHDAQASLGLFTSDARDDDHLQDPFRCTATDTDSVCALPSSSDSYIQITEAAPTQRRRRRTLSELEQYRKWALNKSAYLTMLEIEAEEERQRIRQQEEREYLWITWRHKSKGWTSGGTITRAKSYPPATRSNTSLPTPESRSTWSSPAILPEDDDDLQSTETIDPFLSTWYDEEDQIEHLEYASLSTSSPDAQAASTFCCLPEEDSPPTEELLSPPSPLIDTPRQTKRNLFPSVDKALCQNGMFREGVGLGLGLTGMDYSSRSGDAVYDDEGYMSSQVEGEPLEDALDSDEGNVLREIPITMIFPSRRGPFDAYVPYNYGDDSSVPRSYSMSDGELNDTLDDTQSTVYLEESPVRGRSRARFPVNPATRSGPSSAERKSSTLGLGTSPDSIRYRSSRKIKVSQRSRSESIISRRSFRDLSALDGILDEVEIQSNMGDFDDWYLDEPRTEDDPASLESDDEARSCDTLPLNEEDMTATASTVSTHLNRRHSLSGRLPMKRSTIALEVELPADQAEDSYTDNYLSETETHPGKQGESDVPIAVVSGFRSRSRSAPAH